eukprot:scaffold3721_cov134-Isochrysis_galbana.AAC.7
MGDARKYPEIRAARFQYAMLWLPTAEERPCPKPPARATNEGPRARGQSWDSNPGHDGISVASQPLHHDGFYYA